MEITKVNQSPVNFGSSVMLKTKDVGVLRALRIWDSKLEKTVYPNLRCEFFGKQFCPDEAGFHKVLLGDKSEKDLIHCYPKSKTRSLLEQIVSLAKTIEINDVGELKKLLKLQSVDAIVKSAKG